MLPVSNNNSGGDRSISIGKATIVRAQNISGQQLAYMKYPCDLGVSLTLEVGQSFQPELNITGNFTKDEAGEPKGWGSAFKVRDFFIQMGVDNATLTNALNEGSGVPEAAMETPIGKEVFRLSYVTGRKSDGRLKYSDWSEVATVEQGAEYLLKRFRESVARGYPKNYAPEAVADDTTSFPIVTYAV